MPTIRRIGASSLTTMVETVSPRVAVFITAFNEEAVIGEVIGGIDDAYDVYVIDDGSTDATADVAQRLGASVITHPINLGQGMAITTAFKLLAACAYDVIIEMDGDGQHDPKEIPVFVAAMGRTASDIIAGSRLLGSDYREAPWSRRAMLPPLSLLLRCLTRYRISDFMCGFRAFRGEALRRVAPILDDLVESEYIASEMWVKFAGAGLTATEVPVRLGARKQGRSYKGHALARYGFGILRTIVRAKLDMFRYWRA